MKLPQEDTKQPQIDTKVPQNLKVQQEDTNHTP